MVEAGRPQKLIPLVQGLRALAAFSVAFSHFAHDAILNAEDPRGWLAAMMKFLPWDAGVDVFFVISGFVIVHASASLFGTRGGAGRFLRRRLSRIVPLYWIMTACFLLVLWFARKTIHGDVATPRVIAASFLFIPWPRPDGVMQPAFGLGWTLNYEMFFYVVFTPFFLLRRNLAIFGVMLALSGFVLLGQFSPMSNAQLGYWCNPIILEFCAGMLLAQMLAGGMLLPLPVRILLPLAAIALLHMFAAAGAQTRPLAFGIPACMLVAAAVLAPAPNAVSRFMRLLIRLGDASYAMYLVHPFIMRGLSVLLHGIHAHSERCGIMYMLAGLAMAQCVALMVNLLLERKLTLLLRRRQPIIHEAV